MLLSDIMACGSQCYQHQYRRQGTKLDRYWGITKHRKERSLRGRMLLVTLQHGLTSTLDSGVQTDMIVLEFSKAFDRVPNIQLTRAEYSAFWKCVQAGGMYLFTQLCKMMILATFFPTTEVSSGSLDVIGEFMKCTVDLADLVGIYFIMSRIAGRGQLKFMVAGIGWASAELVVTRFLPLWVGARGVEFDWKYIQMSFDSNISLLHHIGTAMLVWLYNRNDLNKSFVPVVMSLLALSCYRPLIVEILIHAVGLGSWTLLLAKALFTSTVGVIALQMYMGMSSQTVNHYY